jgi:hypothetical protein
VVDDQQAFPFKMIGQTSFEQVGLSYPLTAMFLKSKAPLVMLDA